MHTYYVYAAVHLQHFIHCIDIVLAEAMMAQWTVFPTETLYYELSVASVTASD